MSTYYYYPFLGSVTIETGVNDTLVITEGATTDNAVLAAGTYYMRGDGAADDLALALKTALEAATASVNTYTVTVQITVVASISVACSIEIDRATGADGLTLKWANASTTLDPAAFGFAATDTGADATHTSTKTMSCTWVASRGPNQNDVGSVRRVAQMDMVGGQVHTWVKGASRKRRTMSFVNVDRRRVLEEQNTVDPGATYEAFLEVNGDGRQIEVHKQDAGVNGINALSSTTLVDVYVLDEASVADFTPSRLRTQAVYSWVITLRKYVA